VPSPNTTNRHHRGLASATDDRHGVTDSIIDPLGSDRSDETAPLHWQEKTQLKKGLRGKVRRLVKDLDLDGWAKQVPVAVEQYAVIHYSKP
jgi:hypothetical protein